MRPDKQGVTVFTRDALLLVGHGSTRHPGAGRVLHRHAEALRGAGLFAEVAVGLLNGTPSVAEGLAGLTVPTVHVVPFFMEDGYFARVAVPRALEASGDTRALGLCAPIGSHAGMVALASDRIERFCAPSRLAILCAGHGSARAPGQAVALHRLAAGLADTKRFGPVRVGLLEEAPFIADTLRDLSQHTVAVLGFFAGDGRHVLDDMPALIQGERARRGEADPPVYDLGLIVDEPGTAEIILDRVRASAGT